MCVMCVMCNVLPTIGQYSINISIKYSFYCQDAININFPIVRVLNRVKSLQLGPRVLMYNLLEIKIDFVCILQTNYCTVLTNCGNKCFRFFNNDKNVQCLHSRSKNIQCLHYRSKNVQCIHYRIKNVQFVNQRSKNVQFVNQRSKNVQGVHYRSNNVIPLCGAESFKKNSKLCQYFSHSKND